MLHAFAGDEFVGDLLEADAGGLGEDDFEAVVVLEMHMLRGNDLLQMTVLDLHQPGLQAGFGVVVDDRDGARHDLPAELLLMRDELLADHLRDGLGAARMAARGDHRVELVGKLDGQ